MKGDAEGKEDRFEDEFRGPGQIGRQGVEEHEWKDYNNPDNEKHQHNDRSQSGWLWEGLD